MWCIQGKFCLNTLYPQWSRFISLRFHLFIWIGTFHKFIRKARWDAVGENTRENGNPECNRHPIYFQWINTFPCLSSVRVCILKFIHMLLQCSQPLACALMPYKDWRMFCFHLQVIFFIWKRFAFGLCEGFMHLLYH